MAMHVYVGGACPWLDGHIKSFIRRHVPDAVFVSDPKAIPKDASTVYQFCDGWELNENFAVLNAAANGLINAYPSSDALARKDYMARVIECWTAKRPDSILKTNSPATVRLSLDYAEYVDDALAAADDLTILYSLEDNLNKEPSDREWWILKPALVDCGAGIRIFSTEEELASNLELAEDEDDDEDTDSVTERSEPATDLEDGINPKDFLPTLSTPGLTALDALVTATSSLVIDPRPKKKQQYVFKADGRIPSAQMREFVAQRYIVSIPPLEKRKWHARAYVLSVGRLKVYVFRDMLALLAGEDYAPPWLNPSLRASLTNTGLQEDEDILSKESMRSLWAAPDDLLPGDWKNELFRQVCEVSAELFRGAVHTMADKFTTMNKCFELFALDFLVDTNGTAWLLEVNETPAFYEQGVAGSIALNLMESVIAVTLQHMGLANGVGGMSKTSKARMVQVLDETKSLAKSNITEILPE
ncbi:TTL domain-containing protein [Verticillium alfalfae VaMs.102]|uniref:TTL domain-containing protein n=1 Tax=Verticillium alfalfae (strain VaMs.102 / ATCC MYA-4576 / FGSC 10136) TaxID=526221 RepID=C9SW48_VERA1|nr:TTL domain-containing protein [Verticillium alfalfae VaMs.102]EEY23013.1 TTL domain-containing protein [Verticillium alfalfae VaMs.102]